MRPALAFCCFCLLGGCSPPKHAVVATETMTWRPSEDRSLIELRYLRDPRYFVTVCAAGLLPNLERLGRREVNVQARVWGAWPWSSELYGYDIERVDGMPVQFCNSPGLVSSFEGRQRPGEDLRHPLELHLKR